MYATVEVVDPICLNAKLVEHCCDHCEDMEDLTGVPDCICCCFDDDLVVGNTGKRVFVSLGLFTIIFLERDVQLLIPAFDFCIPDKECIAATDENPCDLFERIKFPLDEFFPPQKFEFAGEDLFDTDRRGCR